MDILINPEVYAQIDYYVQNSPIEVSGLGRIVKHDNGLLEVVKVYLLEQTNTAVETELDGDAIATLMYQTRKDEGMLNFWWHSHVDMSCNWSQTDHEAMEQIGKNGFVLATVFNKKREMRSAFYQGNNHEFLPAIFVDAIPTTIGSLPTIEMVDTWAAELKAKTKTKKVVQHKYPAVDDYSTYNDGYELDYSKQRMTHAKDYRWCTSVRCYVKATKIKKKGKNGNKSKVKETYLAPVDKTTELDSDAYRDLLFRTLTFQEFNEWKRIYREAHGYGEYSKICYEDLYQFYEMWNCDLLEVTNYYKDFEWFNQDDGQGITI